MPQCAARRCLYYARSELSPAEYTSALLYCAFISHLHLHFSLFSQRVGTARIMQGKHVCVCVSGRPYWQIAALHGWLDKRFIHCTRNFWIFVSAQSCLWKLLHSPIMYIYATSKRATFANKPGALTRCQAVRHTLKPSTESKPKSRRQPATLPAHKQSAAVWRLAVLAVPASPTASSQSC